MAVYMLALHPDVLQKLRAEIRSTVGMRRPSYDDIKQMKFLRAFINGLYSFSFRLHMLNIISFVSLEVLRLYPAV